MVKICSDLFSDHFRCFLVFLELWICITNLYSEKTVAEVPKLLSADQTVVNVNTAIFFTLKQSTTRLACFSLQLVVNRVLL